MNRTNKKWTVEEEDRLLQQVRTFPQNLTQCFLIVSESIGRTPQAVANHWYTVVSKNQILPVSLQHHRSMFLVIEKMVKV